MLAILNAPFPSDYGEKDKVVTAVLVGLFVALFLYLFKPFGSAESNLDDSELILKFAGYGVVSCLGVLFIDFVVPKFIPRFFIESSYTVRKELLMAVATILVIGLGNALYSSLYVIQDMGPKEVLVMIWQTFLVGIFPLSFMTILKYNSLLKSNVAISSQIQPSPTESSQELAVSTPTPSITLTTDTESTEIDLVALLYIESVGNYINVTTSNDGELSRQLYRKTLKSVEQETLQQSIVRCHRSYIVNLDRVQDVSGNAQGLKLKLKDSTEAIPVSRKYIPLVKNYFANGTYGK